MKRLALVVVLLLVAAVGYRSFGSAETGTGTLTLAQPAPVEGENARTFAVKDSGGRTFELTDEGVYVLTFWSTLNQGSDLSRPAFDRLAREYGGPKVTFAAVYVNSIPEERAPYTVLQDYRGRLTSLYNVKRVPRLFLVKDGEIQFVQNGYFEDNAKLLQAELRETLAEEDKASSGGGEPERGKRRS
ncbi:MAG: peroxiredoxin family protein [Rubrobacteraceae bacterium]